MRQQVLAERVGVTRQTVDAIELGKHSPSLKVAVRITRITRIFGKPLEEVFSWLADGDSTKRAKLTAICRRCISAAGTLI
jgi:putative transcriptional regulator